MKDTSSNPLRANDASGPTSWRILALRCGSFLLWSGVGVAAYALLFIQTTKPIIDVTVLGRNIRAGEIEDAAMVAARNGAVNIGIILAIVGIALLVLGKRIQ